MAKVHLAWTNRGEAQARWLSELLCACGHDAPQVSPSTSARAKLDQVKKRLDQADCFIGVLVAVKAKDSPYPSRQPCPDFLAELRAALEIGLPAAVLVDQNLAIPEDVNEKCVWWPVDFSEPQSLLAVTASILRFACQTPVRACQNSWKPVKDQPPTGELNSQAIRTTFIYNGQARLRSILSDGQFRRVSYVYDPGPYRVIRIDAEDGTSGEEQKGN